MKTAPSERHTLSILVHNEAGVLVRIVGLFWTSDNVSA